MYEWNESKRQTNLKKHGLDFVNAFLVYENPDKITLQLDYPSEVRMQDVAIVAVAGSVLSLIYTRRGDNVRVISPRRASREERRLYARLKGSKPHGLGTS